MFYNKIKINIYYVYKIYFRERHYIIMKIYKYFKDIVVLKI